jgi:predicted nuclease of predicted toxin-antitoxin system
VRPRLYLDEDVLPELARLLREHGDDAVSAHEVGALSLPDEEQLARASIQGRAILTYNYRDFNQLGEDWFRAGRSHAGIILSYRQYSRGQVGELLRTVLALLDSVSAEELANSVQVLDRFRRR